MNDKTDDKMDEKKKPQSENKTKLVRVAAIQMTSGCDVEKNLTDAESLIRSAAQKGATLIATPEMTALLDKDPKALIAKAQTEDNDKALAHFCQLASELKVTLLIGSLAIAGSADKCVNRSFLINAEGVVDARYDKIHLFDVGLGRSDVYKESNSYIGGAQAVVADANLASSSEPEANERVRLGMSICYDLRFPHLYRDMAKHGAQVLFVPAAFTQVTGEAHWEVLLRSRAIENGCYVVAPAQYGRHEDGRQTYGHSMIIDPWGKVLAKLDKECGVVCADIDLEKVEHTRQKIPSLANERSYTLV